jgi:hypothetical protein
MYIHIRIHTFICAIYAHTRSYMHSQFNTQDRIGGDPELSETGAKYKSVFANFMIREVKTLQSDENLKLGGCLYVHV